MRNSRVKIVIALRQSENINETYYNGPGPVLILSKDGLLWLQDFLNRLICVRRFICGLCGQSVDGFR
jgi:hypothetical protein